MNGNEIEEADKLMRASGYPIRASGGIDDVTINAMEERLGCKFSHSYRTFLQRYGRLAFLSVEFYGFTKDGFEAQKAPSAIWVTEVNRERGEIDKDMVAIMSTGFGPYFVLSTREMDPEGECPVVVAGDNVPEDYRNLGNFGEFFLSEIKSALQIKKEMEANSSS